MTGRNQQVSRIYAALDILEGAPQGLTVSEVADRLKERGLGASKRTVYRDLEALNQAGFPLFPKEEDEESHGTRWILEKKTTINHYLVLSARELLALYIARGVLSPLKETPFYQDLITVFEKIDEKIGTKAKASFQEFTNELQFEPAPRWGLGIDADTLETVRSCCSELQVLRVSYFSANNSKKRVRTLGPHYLYFAKGSLYLVAEDLEDKKVKIFAVPRMSEATMLDQEYSGSVQTPEELLKYSFGVYQGDHPLSVVIDFDSSVGSYVKERQWHQSQRIVNCAEGSIRLSLEVAITPDLIQWVMGFGSHAKVIGPVELQNAIESEALALVKFYNKANKAA